VTKFFFFKLFSADFAKYCSVCRNGAGLPPNLISTNTTGKGSCSVSLGSFMLPPIRALI